MARSPLLAVLCALLAVALPACGGGAEGAQTTGTGTDRGATTIDAAPAPPDETAPTDTGEAPDESPGAVLGGFVEAARANDLDTMWSLLSQGTRERMGPTIVRFESGAGGELRRQLARFDAGRSNVFLDEGITPTFGVAAFGGRVGSGRDASFAAYAAALRQEPDGWRLELGGPVGLAPLAPDPASTVDQRVRVAASVRGEERVVESGLWLDGRSVPGRLALTANGATMFSNESPPLVAGPHAVVAFASTRGDASATAWVFQFSPGGE